MNYLSKITKIHPFGTCVGTASVRFSLRLFLLLALLGAPFSTAFTQDYYDQAIGDNTLHQGDSLFRLSYSGFYRDFIIPVEAAGQYLYIETRGGDGGTVDFNKEDKDAGKGGQGASVIAAFKIGDGPNEIPVGSTIRTIIGGTGGSHTNNGLHSLHGGGGGGGTGVLFLPPEIEPYYESKAEDWIILSVAGGGGGGYAVKYGKIQDGLPGNSGELGTDASLNTGRSSDNGGCPTDGVRWGAQVEGVYTTGGGGGTGYEPVNSIPLCTELESDAPYGDGESGYSGFQISNGRMQPIGHIGGTDGNKGGFGFGSGGSGDDKIGGGGGFTGGNGAFKNTGKASGGGSYVNSAYAAQGSCVKIKNRTTRKSEDGYILYRFIDSFELPSLSTGQEYTNTTGESLLTYGDYTLRWQKDGNLVLYKGEFSAANAQWATGTEGQGYKLTFQNDGNLVIRDVTNKAIWSSATADAQQGVKGGVKLLISPYGQLIIHNVDYASIWSAN